MTTIDVFKDSPSFALLSSVFAFVDEHAVGTAAAETKSKSKPLIAWSTPLVPRYVTLSENRGKAMLVLHVRAVRDPALAALFEKLRPWRDDTGNTLLFKETPAAWPQELATLLSSMLPVLEPIYLAAQTEASPAAAKKPTKSKAK